MSRPLVLAAHGTADAAGQAVAHDLATAVAARVGAPTRLGFVDVCQPTLEAALAGLVAPIVVPVFLTSGYHVRQDVPAAAGQVRGAVVTAALGAEPEIVDALADRLARAQPTRLTASPPRSLVVAAAGSSDTRARGEVDLVVARLGAVLHLAAFAGSLSGPGPTLEDAVLAASDVAPKHRPFAAPAMAGPDLPPAVAVSALLLGPGHFDRQLRRRCAALGLSPADPVGAHPRIVDLVVRRYQAALRMQTSSGARRP